VGAAMMRKSKTLEYVVLGNVFIVTSVLCFLVFFTMDAGPLDFLYFIFGLIHATFFFAYFSEID